MEQHHIRYCQCSVQVDRIRGADHKYATLLEYVRQSTFRDKYGNGRDRYAPTWLPSDEPFIHTKRLRSRCHEDVVEPTLPQTLDFSASTWL
jgi:hypothetical protein